MGIIRKVSIILFTLFWSGKVNATAVLPDTSRQELLQLIGERRGDEERIKLIYQLSYSNIYKLTATAADSTNTLLWLKEGLRISNILHSLAWKLKFTKLTGEYYLNHLDYLNGEYYFKKAINICIELNDKTTEGELWKTLADEIEYTDSKNIDKSLIYFDNALKLFRQTSDKNNEIEVEILICRKWIEQGKLERAQKKLEQLIFLVKNKYPELHSEITESLASIAVLEGNSIDELNYRIEAVKSMQLVNKPDKLGTAYYNLSTTYFNQRKYSESLIWAEKCFTALKNNKLNLDTYMMSGDLYIANLLALKLPKKALVFLTKRIKDVPPDNFNHQLSIYEDFGNIYTALGRYQQAETNYIKMIKTLSNVTVYDKTQNTFGYVNYFVHYYKAIIKFYITTHQYIKAKPYLTFIFKLHQNQIAPVKRSQYHFMQFKVDSALGNYRSAINEYEIHKAINDSLFNAGKQKQLDELTLKFQTSQKEHSIRLLESKSKNQEIIVQKANLQRNVTFIGIVMLFILTGLTYRGYQLKRKSNNILQLKQIEINYQNKKLADLIYQKDELLVEKDKLLTEKDWLMKEVHHRVKNNLQIVMSLLNTQSAFLANGEALDAIKKSQNRVQAIALIHHKLYSGKDITSINMPSYITDLMNNLKDSFDLQRQGIILSKEIDEISLDLSQAIPIGLFINEAITNAIKYAFDSKGGEISVTLNYSGVNTMILKIKDNGKGMSNFDFKTIKSLGMELMKALCAQLKGRLILTYTQGVTVGIDFQIDFTFTQKKRGNIELS